MLDDRRLGGDLLRQAAGGDHLHFLTELAAEPRDQPLHQPHVAEEDARLHRHRGVRADGA